MTDKKLEHIQHWLIKANEDIAVINQLAENMPEQYTGAICYHSQQAVEMFLKAHLIREEAEYRRTHDLDYLLAECSRIEAKGFEDIDLKSLTDYGISVRYPDDFFVPELSEALEYRDIALRVKHIVEKKDEDLKCWASQSKNHA